MRGRDVLEPARSSLAPEPSGAAWAVLGEFPYFCSLPCDVPLRLDLSFGKRQGDTVAIGSRGPVGETLR